MPRFAALLALACLAFPALAGCGGGTAGFDAQLVPAASPQPVATPTSQAATAVPGTVPPSPSPPATTGTITLAAAGDVMLGRTIGDRILAGGPAVPFEHVAPVLTAADIAVVNLEGPLASPGTGAPAAKGYTFLGPPPAVDALARAGIDAVSLANNHSLDYGSEALAETTSLLDEAGIAHAGAGANAAAARAPAILDVGGVRIALLAYVDTPAEGAYSRASWEATAGGPGVAWLDAATLATDIQAAAAGAGLVVVFLHFGQEFNPAPTEQQRTLARAAIDAGASLVLGAHPHLLQEIEEYGGGLIAYSLGNFVFDGFDGPSNQSAILLVELSSAGVQSYRLLPVEIIENGIPRPAGP